MIHRLMPQLIQSVAVAARSILSLGGPCLVGMMLLTGSHLMAQDAETEKDSAENKSEEERQAGHSIHGEVFNEGPRQKAYLMGGTGNVSFPVTTENETVQALINQGVGQLHGFWYFEAERSFRQAAALDPECAIAYWGMTLANINNLKRSKGFIAEAVKRKEKASPREQAFINCLNDYVNADPKKPKKERSEKYTRALEKICYEHPDDLESKAMLGLQLWHNRRAGLPMLSHLAVDALLNEVLSKNPMHPCHHYRIHLWDYQKADKALNSAALCGQSAPGIAHMWHMPGHIYSRLKRYEDAAWQQEASARVDHAHMMRDGVLPDQIHNFAHNNEWLIRNLIHLGRADAAVSLARNMIELPRHPRYNTMSRRGSSWYGRERLFQSLSQFELWPQMIELSETSYLEPTDLDEQQLKRLRHLGQAFYRSGDLENGDRILAQLQKLHEERVQEQNDAVKAAEDKARKEYREKNKPKDEPKSSPAAADSTPSEVDQEKKPDAQQAGDSETQEAQSGESEAEQKEAEQKSEEPVSEEEKKAVSKAGADAKKKLAKRVDLARRAADEVDGHRLVANSNFSEGLEKLKKAGGVSTHYRAWIRFQAGEQNEAIEELKKYLGSHENEVIPLGVQVEMLTEAGQHEEAVKLLTELGTVAGTADADLPLIQRLNKVAGTLGQPADWRKPRPIADDVGDRPDHDSLGPFRWSPSPAKDFELPDQHEKKVSLTQFKGKPVVIIFYLGYGCLHCAEQLEAFAPRTADFKAEGIELIAISTDTIEDLQKSHKNYKNGEFPFPLVSDSALEIFKQYRAFDDFENQALHGTFLVDGNGQIRWQDISYDPFQDPGFLLKEAKRLLNHSGVDFAGSRQPAIGSEASGDDTTGSGD